MLGKVALRIARISPTHRHVGVEEVPKLTMLERCIGIGRLAGGGIVQVVTEHYAHTRFRINLMGEQHRLCICHKLVVKRPVYRRITRSERIRREP